MEELVVLVNKKNQPIGTAPKAKVHTAHTRLHRGFSVFLFNACGQLLLQQRSRHKRTFPLIWSNSCCGHPGVGEKPIQAAKRRLKDELGIRPDKIYMLLPDFYYRAEMDGVVENEICPVMIAFCSQEPQPNPNEVENIRWIPWTKFIKEAKANPDKYSSWSSQEALLLMQNPKFHFLYAKNVWQ